MYIIGTHQPVDASVDWEMEPASWHWQRPLSTARGWLYVSLLIKQVCPASYISWQHETACICCWVLAVQRSIDMQQPNDGQTHSDCRMGAQQFHRPCSTCIIRFISKLKTWGLVYKIFYNNLMIMSKLRLTYDKLVIYKTSYDCRKRNLW